MKCVILHEHPVDVNSLQLKLGNNCDGAVVIFTGLSRNTSVYRPEETVEYLEYEIYETMAIKELNKIADYAIETFKLSDCVISHRFGRIMTGEVSVFIGVSSGHRNAAFDAARYIIETIKKTVPVWKTEHYSDGTEKIINGS